MILIYFSKSCWLERLRPKLADMLTIHHGQGVLIIENFQSMFLEEVLEMYFFFFWFWGFGAYFKILMLKLLPIKKDEQRTGKARSPANCGTFRLFFFFPIEKYKLLLETKLVSVFGSPRWDSVWSLLEGREIRTWVFPITFAFYCWQTQ